MDYTLKRLLTYTDKYRIEEFELPERVHDVLYELFVTTKEDVPVDDLTFVKVFNEVFYMLTCIFADKTSPEHVAEYLDDSIVLTPPEDEYSNQKAYEDDLYYIQRYIFSFVWIILKTHKSLPKHVRFFLIALEHRLEQENSTSYARFKAFLQKHTMQNELDFPLNPIFDFDIPGRTVDEWEEVTFDFDKETVAEIVHRFHHIESRELIISEIRKALEEANELPYSSKKVSMRTHCTKANDAFLDELLKEGKEEQTQRVEQEKAIEQSKDERIAELEAQIKDLKSEKRDAESDRDHWKREYEHLVRRINERNQQIQQKHIPSEFRQLPGSEIIKQLVNEGLIRVLRRQIASDAYEELYKWEGSKKLFGYFVERVSDELSLRKSGKSGNIIWEPFMQAFYNAEELRHEAASAISAMKKKGALMPDGADKIEEAIKYADAMAMQYKD